MRSFGQTLLMTAGLAAAAASFAQEAAAPRRDGIFLESVDVRLTNLEVYVTRNGQPVDDLVAEDFEILDDGQPVEITHFFRVEDGRRVGTGEPPSDEATGEEASGEEAIQPEVQESSTLVILVDQAFLSPRGRQRALDALTGQLDQLMSGETRVIVVNKGLRLDVALTSTSDPGEVRAVLEQVAGQATANPAGDTSDLLRGIQRLDDDEEDNFGIQAAHATFDRLRAYSQQVHGQMRSSFDLLERFVRSLGGIDGRKAVVYVADELPVRPAEVEWHYWFEAFGEAFGLEFGVTSAEALVDEFDLSSELESLIAEASTNRVIFYPTGVGKSIGDVFSVANPRLVGRPGHAQEGLRWLAEGTGGRAAVGRFRGDTFFGALHQDLTHYYSLAYPSPHPGDGRVHRISVRVRRDDLDGVEVRYLARYRDRPPGQQADEAPLTTLRFGGEQNPLEVEVAYGEPEKQKGGLYALPLVIRFPLANLVLLADRQSHNGKVSFRIVALDEKGRSSVPVTLEAPIEIPHDALLEALSRQAIFRPQLMLRRGRQTVAIEVRDEVGSVNSTVLVEVEVGGKG